jgi:hypothetical protein
MIDDNDGDDNDRGCGDMERGQLKLYPHKECHYLFFRERDTVPGTRYLVQL